MFEEILHLESSVRLNNPCDTSGPSGLVTGADTRAGVAMEVLNEQNVVPPVRVGLKLFRASINRPPRMRTNCLESYTLCA